MVVYIFALLLIFAQLLDRPACSMHSQPVQCASIQLEQRLDCYPDANMTEQACRARGCCWQPARAASFQNVPSCYYPLDFPSYKFTAPTKYSDGYKFTAVRTEHSFRPQDIMQLSGTVQFYKGGIVRLRVFLPF